MTQKYFNFFSLYDIYYELKIIIGNGDLNFIPFKQILFHLNKFLVYNKLLYKLKKLIFFNK